MRTRRKCPGTVSPVTQDQRPVWSWEGVVASEGPEDRAGEWAGTSRLHLHLCALGLGPSSAPLGGDGHASRQGWVRVSAKSLLRPTPPVGERGGRPHWNGQEPFLDQGHGRGGRERPVEGQSGGVGGGGRSLTRPLSRAFCDFVLPSRRLSVLSACTEEGLSGKVIGAAGALTVPDWSCPVCRLSPLPPLTLSFQRASWRE